MNSIGNQKPAAKEPHPSAATRPIQWRMNLADSLNLDYVSVNFTGNNPADVTLKLPTMTIKGCGKTAETYSAMVYERDGSPRWPSTSELRTLRQAVADKIHSQPADSTGSVGNGLELTLRVVDQMITKQTHGVPDRFDDQVSVPAHPKQAPKAVTLFHH